MNRKYIRLRRFLGISTILLGLLIAIIPTFSRAATDITAVVERNNWGSHGAGEISAVYHFEGNIDTNTYISLELSAENDGPSLSDFIANGLITLGEKDRAADLFIYEKGRTEAYGSFTAELSMPMPLEFSEIPGDDIDVYRIEMQGNSRQEFSDVAVDNVNDIQVVTVFTNHLAMNDETGSYAFVYVKRYPEKATETPTPTNTPVPTKTPTPRPTERADGTPTPTPLPLRLVQIDDQRGDRSDTNALSAMVYGGSLPNMILIVRDSDGVGIKRIVVMRKGMKMKPWNIRLVDDKRRTVTDFDSLTVTLPIPASWDLEHGRVTMVGSRRDGKIKVFDTDIVDQSGYKAAKFKIEEFTDYEYGMIYTPEGSDEDESGLIVSDERNDKTGTEHISGNVTEGSGKRTLHIADSDSDVIRQRIVWKNGMLLDRYRIWISDEEGNDVNDFGTLTVTLPLSEEMDPSKGTIRVVGSTPDKATDDFLPEIIKNDDGTYSVRFSTDYFSDHEYGVVYTPYSAEPESTPTPIATSTSTPTPTKAGTPTPTLSPTPYANQTNTPTPTKKPTGTPTPTRSADPLITGSGNVSVTPTPLPPTGSYGRGPGSGPIVTPKGRGFTEDGVSMNYANTGKNGGSTGGNSGSQVKGGSYSNAKDMPKTGMADVPRMLLVIILVALGCIQIVTTIPLKKE